MSSVGLDVNAGCFGCIQENMDVYIGFVNSEGGGVVIDGYELLVT